MRDPNPTLTQTFLLLDTFVSNAYGYLLLFVPLVLVYEAYRHIYNENKTSINFIKLLLFFSSRIQINKENKTINNLIKSLAMVFYFVF